MGVTFTTEVFNIWDVNANEIVAKVENLCKQWSKRKLTLFGRITVIKSLALSKFNHLFLALNLLNSLKNYSINFYGTRDQTG